MTGQIDGIGDDRGRGIGLRRCFRQHGDGIRDTERKTAAVPPAGRDAPHRIIGVNHHRSHQAMPVGPVHQADGELLAAGEMQRYVTAIIDVSALELCRGKHRAENFFRDATRHGRHRRDEVIGSKRRDSRMHAARDETFQRASNRISGRSEFNQLLAEFIEQAGEACCCGLVGGAHIPFSPLRLDDKIDRTVLQMQPLAVWKERDLREPFHARRPGI
jgi:hypothetical protein